MILNKTGVINDPLGQTHSHAISEHCFLMFCFARIWKVGTDGGTTCAITIIPTGRDFGLAEWINICINLSQSQSTNQLHLTILVSRIKQFDINFNNLHSIHIQGQGSFRRFQNVQAPVRGYLIPEEPELPGYSTTTTRRPPPPPPVTTRRPPPPPIRTTTTTTTPRPRVIIDRLPDSEEIHDEHSGDPLDWLRISVPGK